MRLKSFTVQGFKNLADAVTFGPLPPISVLHGINNAGKTNVLRAMDAAFRLLRTGNHVTKDQMVSLEAASQPAGYPFEEIFNVRNPQPIQWQLELALEAEELADAGIEGDYPTDHVAIAMDLSPGLGTAGLRITKFLIGDTDAATKDPARDGPLLGFAQQLRAYVGRTYSMEVGGLGAPFELLDVRPCAPEAGGLVPQTLRDALFDARQSLKREERRRWSLFVRLARELEPELGAGQFDTSFDRATGRAGLVYDTGDAAVPVDWLGSGIQRFVTLLASLALSRAAFVALEEPELHLSYSLQQRLRRVMLAVAKDGGAQQFFISSHSTALDDLESSFVLELKDGALVIEQRTWQDSAAPPPPAPPMAREFGDSLAEAAPAEVAVETPAEPAAAPPDLDDLIGLVDQLSELDPKEILTNADGADAKAPAAAGASRPEKPGANGERVVDAAPWRRPPDKR